MNLIKQKVIPATLLVVGLWGGVTNVYSDTGDSVKIRMPVDSSSLFKTRLTSDQAVLNIQGITTVNLYQRQLIADVQHNILEAKTDNGLKLWKEKLNKQRDETAFDKKKDRYRHLNNILPAHAVKQPAQPIVIANTSLVPVIPDSVYTRVQASVHTLPEGIELSSEILEKHASNTALVVNPDGQSFVISTNNDNGNLSVIVTFEQDGIRYLYQMEKIDENYSDMTFSIAYQLRSIAYPRLGSLQKSFKESPPMSNQEIIDKAVSLTKEYGWYVSQRLIDAALVIKWLWR